MREDLPSGELHDLCPARGDGKVPIGWARSIDQACTAWLLKRGLYGSPALTGLSLSPRARPESEEDETDIGPANVKVNGVVFRRRRIRAAADSPAPAVSGTGTEALDHTARVLGEEQAR